MARALLSVPADLPSTLQMAFESPSPPPQNKTATWLEREPQRPPDPTPARAIAEAWIMETKESQDKWKEVDAKLKDLFNRPNRQVPLGRKAKM
ncbi:hypothetical protein F5148DRAFT_1172912 [Russula earlei]|uniref:Uncharacterized protein n=1 Tax=Russula earlei TaxID=71964 RepID=A0ACC0UHB8_9AGAM|nr:hypothetical protein F5148DRAFT_1172912 [Russula earlei]